MTRIASIAIAVVIAAVTAPPAVLHAAPLSAGTTAGTVTITVTYKGKGTVNGSHKLFVWLFDSPNIGSGSFPIAQVSLDTNATAAVFDGVSADKVYVAVAFDELGVMTGDGPPPTGTPIGLYAGKDGAPIAVVPGDKGVATLVFDDSQKMQ